MRTAYARPPLFSHHTENGAVSDGPFQSIPLRYSLKPVNDSMRPPQVLLLSDSKPYSPKVNSMM